MPLCSAGEGIGFNRICNPRYLPRGDKLKAIRASRKAIVRLHLRHTRRRGIRVFWHVVVLKGQRRFALFTVPFAVRKCDGDPGRRHKQALAESFCLSKPHRRGNPVKHGIVALTDALSSVETETRKYLYRRNISFQSL